MTIGVYVARRVLRGVLALLLVVVVAYGLFAVLPDQGAGVHGSLPDYLKAIFLHLNLGYSQQQHSSVLSLIVARLPATASLVLGALLLWMVVAIPVAIVTAVRRGTRFDKAFAGAAVVLGSAPAFWLGLLGLYLFAQDVGQFSFLPGAKSYVGLTADPGKWFTSLILPWLAIGLTQGALASVLLRRDLSGLSERDYLIAARARGVPERTVVWRHAARAAAAPLLRAVGLELGALIGAAVVVEAAFSIPGVGMLVYESIRRGDLVTVEGTVVLAGLFMVLVNMAVDVVRGVVDPRTRAGRAV
ncbi:MAG TPA: ABC transporter permease [Solirubrobacteraceae bacterium]|nr:ABC transporter permease [Solirubrobacteraceae bacterium]